MRSIGELFSRIQGRFAKETAARLAIRATLKDGTGIDLPLEAISFSSTTLILKGLSPAARSAVFTKKPAILKAIGSRPLGRVVTDIRFNS